MNIIKKFDDCVSEILTVEKELKKFPTRIPTEEVGTSIKVFEYDYYEMIAEIRKFLIIKNLVKEMKE
jgi:hypothetical protein